MLITRQKKHDDWDVKVLGADEEKASPPSTKPNMKDLVNYFRDRTTSFNTSINSTVNGPAFMNVLKGMFTDGVTHDQVYQMIDMFADDIRKTPLNADQIPWRIFAARRSELYKRVQNGVVKKETSEYTFDPRLEKYLND